MKLPFFNKSKAKKEARGKDKEGKEKAKQSEREGSKYGSLILLLVTVLVGLAFYLQGQISTQGFEEVWGSVADWFSFSKEFVIE